MGDDGRVNMEQHPRPEVAGHHVESVIGAGATSVVWSGTDAVGRPVAIKVPRELPDAVALMQGEIERHVLQAVRHEHLVPLRDVVALPDGRVALIFDLVRGASVKSTVDARGRLRPGETVTVLTPLCEAVAALHAAGGTHGDVSARNVMVTAEGRPLLMDLGAARLAGSGSGVVHGTNGFVAPEVQTGEAPPSEASDVFGLGALAWFCLTGNGAPDTTMRLDPETIRSHVGPELADVIGLCIDPNPSRRPSAAELGPLFFHAVRAEPIEVVVGGDEASALTNRLRLDAAREAPSAPESRRRWSRLGRPGPGTSSAGRSRTGRAFRPAWLGRLRVSPRRLGAALLGLVLCAALVGAWSLTGRTLARGLAAGSAHESGVAEPPGTTPTTTASAGKPTTRPAADPTLDPTAASTRPAALLQTLADRRADALTRRDVTLLAGVHHQGAGSAAPDERIIERLRANGQRYTALRLTVSEAKPVAPAGAARSAERAVIRARVDVAAYGVRQGDGTSTAQPSAVGTRLDYAVVRTAAGWRLEAITEPRAG